MRKGQKGFSLIELLIVILIIGIIAAIAVPNLLSARRAANESSAVASMRVLHGAQVQYKATSGAGNYAGTISTNGDTSGLTELARTGFIDSSLGSGNKSGYAFVGARELETSTSDPAFFFSCIPKSPSGITKTGSFNYGVATDGVIRFTTGTGIQLDKVGISNAYAVGN